MFLIGFPLLVVPLAIYNIIALLMPGVGWTSPLASIVLPSQAEWALTMSDALIGLALFLLILEAVKATRIHGRPLMDHLLSALVFLVSVAEFLLVKQAATATFAAIAAICLVDVLAGLAICRTTRRDRRAVAASEPAAAQP